MKKDLMKKNEFLIGCNYWASNAGCFTWKKFDAEVIKKDLEFLASYGVNCIRIFPSWDDFQPIRMNLVPSSPYFDKKPFKMRVGEEIMRDQQYASGLQQEKVEQFRFLLNCAKQNGMKVIVSFITGWMSGRRFIPEAFLGKDVIADPECIIWECDFIKDLISQIKDYDNIIAYEPGNECNCLSYQADEKQVELWVRSICDTIRLADPTRPVYSGVHGTKVQGTWNIPMQGKYFDVLTTHPYPQFTPYCNLEDIRQMRASLHAAAETHFYGAISNRTCMVEEINALGQENLSDDFMPEYYDAALATSLAVGTNGFLWWCAYEQDGLGFEPYNGNALERNLGLAHVNHTPKPVLEAMRKSRELLDEVGGLPKPQTDGVVVLPVYCDQWKVAYGAFMMAVQSGRMVDFYFEEQPIKESDFYILPSLGTLSTYALMPIIERVKEGATLLVTLSGGAFADFENLSGLKSVGKSARPVKRNFTVNGKQLEVTAPCEYKLLANTAEVLIADEQGNIVLSSNKVGKGKVMVLTFPLEETYTETYMPEESNLHEIYSYLFKDKKKIFSIDSSRCMVTIHELTNGKMGVMLNNFDESCLPYQVCEGYKVDKVLFAKLNESKITFDRKYAYIELIKA